MKIRTQRSISKLRPYAAGALVLIATAVISTGCGSNTNYSPSANSATTMKPLNQKPRPITEVRHGDDISIQMYTEETEVYIAPGVKFPAWTFDGTVPGPVIYLRQGDHVSLTLHNIDPRMVHSIDLHAALVPNSDFSPILPGHSKTIRFVASIPGVFMYHCESSPMPLHIAQGMYGAVIVTPTGQKPPLYTLVQSEFYKADNLNSVLNSPPRYVVFNGYADRYVAKPLSAPLDKSFTIAVVDAGPNDFAAFHVIGSILRDVHDSGDPQNSLYDVSTYTIPPGGGASIDLEFTQPGQYAFVSHVMDQAWRGDEGAFVVQAR